MPSTVQHRGRKSFSMLEWLGSCFPARVFDNASKRFLSAAQQGNDQLAAATLANRPELITSTTLLHRKTALHLSAEHGHVAVMASVLEMMAESASLEMHKAPSGGLPGEVIASVINSRDSEGRTALIIACANNQVECARLLLANGAWRGPVDDRGNSALHYASSKGYLGILLLLLTEFLDELQLEQEQAAAAAASAGSVEVARHTPGRQTPTELSHHRQQPLLPSASSSGVAAQPDVTRLVNVANYNGFTPLHFAVWAKQSGAVQVLLQHGADLVPRTLHPGGGDTNIPCPGESTPLHLAAMRGHIEISRILLKTFYERVLEPMQLQASAVQPGSDRDAVQRSLAAVDPRTQTNGMGLIPSKVAHRMGFLQLATLLKPQIPLARLFSEEEHRTRFYGPPALKLLAAEALNRKLLAALTAAMAEAAAAAAVSAARSTTPSLPMAAAPSIETLNTASTELVLPIPPADGLPMPGMAHTAESTPVLPLADQLAGAGMSSPTSTVAPSAISCPQPLSSFNAARADEQDVCGRSTGVPDIATAAAAAVGDASCTPSSAQASTSHSQQQQPQQQAVAGAPAARVPQSGSARGMNTLAAEYLLPTVSEADEDDTGSGPSSRRVTPTGGAQSAARLPAGAEPWDSPLQQQARDGNGVAGGSQGVGSAPQEANGSDGGSKGRSPFAGVSVSPFAVAVPQPPQQAGSTEGALRPPATAAPAAEAAAAAVQRAAELGAAMSSMRSSSLPNTRVPSTVTSPVAGGEEAAVPTANHLRSSSSRAASSTSPRPHPHTYPAGRQSAPGGSQFPVSRFAADPAGATSSGGAIPARQVHSTYGSGASLTAATALDAAGSLAGTAGFQPLSLLPSAASSRVIALQRGNSITLVGALSGAAPSQAEAIAPFMALDNLATLVEDTPSATARGSLACGMWPRGARGGEDEADALLDFIPHPSPLPSPLPLLAGEGSPDGPSQLARSRTLDSPGVSHPSDMPTGLLRNVAGSATASRLSASGAAQMLRAAVARSLSLSGLQPAPAAAPAPTVADVPQDAASHSGNGDAAQLPANSASATEGATAAGPAAAVAPQQQQQPGNASLVVGAAAVSAEPAATTAATSASVVAAVPTDSSAAATAEPAGDTTHHDAAEAAPEPAPAPAPQLPQLPQSAAVAAVVAAAAAAAGVDDEEDECGVCLEHPPVLVVRPCQHIICGPCARKMCTLNAQRTPHCPFCRAIIADFKPNMELAARQAHIST